MGTSRKLDQEQQREVAIAYLCGVKPDTIAEKYDICTGTITGNILRKYSREWNDDLVEHLRKTPGRERIRNSAAVYLNFRSREVDNWQLFRQTPIDVSKLVSKHVYSPGITKVVKETGIRLYAHPPEDYMKLLYATVFGQSGDPGYKIVDKLVLDKLELRYQDEKKLSLPKLFSEVKDEVVQSVKKGGLSCTPKKKEIIDHVLGTLTDIESKVLELRFGLYDKQGMDLDEVAAEFGATKEWVRVFESRGLQKLRHPSRSNYLRGLLGLVTDEQAGENFSAVKTQEEREKWIEDLRSGNDERGLKEIALDRTISNRLDGIREEASPFSEEVYDKRLDKLEFSVRTANNLQNLGVRTIGDLMDYTPMRLFKDFGRKSLNELTEILADIGVKLPRE
jgi:hypothetical protein